MSIAADVADSEQGHHLIDTTRAEFSRIDVWVSNSGVAPELRLDPPDRTPTSWDRVLGLKLRGPFFPSQAVARGLINLIGAGAVRASQIHFNTAVSSTFAGENRGEYRVANSGQCLVAQLFAIRLIDHGINFFEVITVILATDMRAW